MSTNEWRDGVVAAHQAHNLGSQKDKVGSIPTPATKHRIIS